MQAELPTGREQRTVQKCYRILDAAGFAFIDEGIASVNSRDCGCGNVEECGVKR